MNAREAFDLAGTDKGSYHGYEKLYDRIFATPQRLLELGVYEGASLKAWRLLWPDCDVWGIDKDPLRNAVDGTHFIQADAYAVDPFSTGLTFDIIIDDADHAPWHQVEGVKLYWPRLNKNGWYIIEDVRDDHYLSVRLSGWAHQPNAHGDYSIWWKRNAAAG